MKILVAAPRGFCAGVRRAIEIVDVAINRNAGPIYVRKEIVHNKRVVDDFRARGVVFIEELKEAPAGATVIFSAHGISPAVRDDARIRNLKTIDATCPLVTKVHLEVHRFLREGYFLVLIGHKNHDEVVGTMGEAPGRIHLVEDVGQAQSLEVPEGARVMVLTQTTLSVDETREILGALRRRFPSAQTPPKDDICYATQNRQDAVRELLNRSVEVLLVVGSKNSSNSQRLCDVARENGRNAYLIDDASEIQPDWLDGTSIVGVTAGASAPEFLVENVVTLLKERYGAGSEEVFVREENVVFSLPRELTSATAN